MDYTVFPSPRITFHSRPGSPHQLLPGRGGRGGSQPLPPVPTPGQQAGQSLRLARASRGHWSLRSLRGFAGPLFPRGCWPLLTSSRVRGLLTALAAHSVLGCLLCPKSLLTLSPKHPLPPTYWATRNKLTPFRFPRASLPHPHPQLPSPPQPLGSPKKGKDSSPPAPTPGLPTPRCTKGPRTRGFLWSSRCRVERPRRTGRCKQSTCLRASKTQGAGWAQGSSAL